MAQSTNILIGSPGIASQTSTIMIGNTQTDTYCAGIYGQSIGATNKVLVVDSDNKLGTTTSSDGNNSFLFYLGTNVTNVTGDSTIYYLGSTTALTAEFDNSGGAFYAGDGSGVGTAHAAYFQAPETGHYFFNLVLEYRRGQIANLTYLRSFIETPSNVYANVMEHGFVGDQSLVNSTLVSLSAGEKAYFSFSTLYVVSSIVDGIFGNTNPNITYVSGFRVN